MKALPVAEASNALDRSACPVEARRAVKKQSSASGLRPRACPAAVLRSTLRLAHLEASYKTAITSGKASPEKPGKTPHKAFRPRVWKQIAAAGACRQEVKVRAAVGTLWNSRIVVDCGGKKDCSNGREIESPDLLANFVILSEAKNAYWQATSAS